MKKNTRRGPRPAPQYVRMQDHLPTTDQASPEILAAARQVVSEALPKTFQFGGKTVWLTVGIGYAQIKIFDTPDKTEPLAKQFFSCMPVDPCEGNPVQTHRISVLPLRHL